MVQFYSVRSLWDYGLTSMVTIGLWMWSKCRIFNLMEIFQINHLVGGSVLKHYLVTPYCVVESTSLRKH